MGLLDRVTQFIARHHLFDPGQRVLVAVSGGPDSVALLHLLVAWDRACELHVAHLDHGIRGDASVRDALWVANLAEQLGLPCHTAQVDVPGLCALRGGSIETVARDQRYRFLSDVARTTGCARVALGHHADDQVETVLARLLRGTGLRGLAGMPVRRALPGAPAGCEIVRPLLGVSRADIIAFLDEQSLSYRTDATNADVAYQRNWIRHGLLPVLEHHAGAGVRTHLLRLVDQAQLVHEHLDACVDKLLQGPDVDTSPHCWRVPRRSCRDADPAVVGALVWSAVGALGGALGDLTYGKVADWVGAVRGPSARGSADLPGAVRLVWDADTVRFEGVALGESAKPPAFHHALAVPDAPGMTTVTDVPEARCAIEARVLAYAAAAFEAFLRDKGPDQEAFDRGAVVPPLIVRRVAPGDRIDVLGLDGTKKVQDILVDAKVDRARRARVPLVCDARGPLWLVGLRRGERARVADGCQRILVLRTVSGLRGLRGPVDESSRGA